MFRGNANEFLNNMTYAGIPLSEYIAAYTQQISLAFVFSIFFRIINCDILEALRILNIIGNILIVFSLYKINTQLSKKYKTNKVLLFTLILTFMSLPMLATFVYGDTLGTALCLLSVYFIMKYSETKQIKNALIAAVLTMIAYMLRMNSLIFIIATVIYLVLNLIKGLTNKKWQEVVLATSVIIGYVVISIIPSSIVQNYYMNKYNIEKGKSMPTTNYILMGMEESYRGNGWYRKDRGEYSLKNREKAIKEYPEEIKERLTYFLKNPSYTIRFYLSKTASMWSENTYAAVRENINPKNENIQKMWAPLIFYQKILLIITTACSLIVLIQNRKKLSLEVIFLVTIFIGGFAFHTLWEAKSRYIIPYILILIPLASITIEKFNWKKQKNG